VVDIQRNGPARPPPYALAHWCLSLPARRRLCIFGGERNRSLRRLATDQQRQPARVPEDLL